MLLLASLTAMGYTFVLSNDSFLPSLFVRFFFSTHASGCVGGMEGNGKIA